MTEFEKALDWWEQNNGGELQRELLNWDLDLSYDENVLAIYQKEAHKKFNVGQAVKINQGTFNISYFIDTDGNKTNTYSFGCEIMIKGVALLPSYKVEPIVIKKVETPNQKIEKILTKVDELRSADKIKVVIDIISNLDVNQATKDFYKKLIEETFNKV